jgi:uncharacterized protein YecE (DUF72 family)
MKPRFHIGCSGFYNKHWKEVFYPSDLPQKEWLTFYSNKLHTLELNVTFYRFPSLRTMQNWYNKSPEDFIFSVKAPKLITHMKQFEDCERLFNDFYGVCEQGLQQKLGCILFQLPPTFQYEEEKLEKILSYMDDSFHNVLEFRHPSWWDRKVYNKLTDRKISFCTVSHPKLPDTLVCTTDTAYVRLHGDPKLFYSEYSAEYLEKLKKSLLKKQKLRDVYIYFNNTASTAGILNALDFQMHIPDLQKII